LQSTTIEGTPNLSAVPLRLHYPGTSQHAQMPGDERLTEPELSAKLRHRHTLMLRKILDYLEALSIGKRPEVNGKFLHITHPAARKIAVSDPAVSIAPICAIPYKPNLNKGSLICY
jgi:hypothetical protein